MALLFPRPKRCSWISVDAALAAAVRGIGECRWIDPLAPGATGETEEVAMKKLALLLSIPVLLGFGATAQAQTEQAAGPSGFSAATESANSKGKTGETAECPIKKTVGGKTYCFQNDPALTKQQGGH
jgi:hypothetical protein